MGTRPVDARPPWRRQLTRGGGIAVLVVAVLAGAWYVHGVATSATEEVTVHVSGPGVDGQSVTLDGDASVGDALVRAGIRPHDGRLLSVRDGTVVDEHHDPAHVTIDGRPAAVGYPVADGMRITVADGVDEREATVVVEETVAAKALPDVLTHVHHQGQDGIIERTVGERSGEVVDSTVLREPTDPKRTEERYVALTFDDGPSPTWTPQLLLLLGVKGVKATFCQPGEQIAKDPDLTRQLADAGHRLCNHTVTHPSLTGASAEVLDAEIGGGAKAITDLGISPPRYFRAADGAVDQAIIDRVAAEGESVLGWSIDGRDWVEGTDAKTILDGILAEVEPGSIILLREGGGEDRRHTLLATSLLIDVLRDRGYRFSFPLLPVGR